MQYLDSLDVFERHRDVAVVMPGLRIVQTHAVDDKTVIVHELAHLRRRDHWVGWLQLAGECIFWWNPLFWFVRRQIRFQAELSCDAWVMRLLPEARRAYAEALIEVTALISRAACSRTGVGHE